MTRMFFLAGIAMFIAALVILVGMHRGLRATLVEPMAADTVTGDEQ